MAAAWKYLPVLKWKQGERIALRNLTKAQWSEIVPLVELLPLDTTDDKLLPAVVEATQKRGLEMEKAVPADVPIAIDVRYFRPTYLRPARLLYVVCKRLAASSKREIIPVITEAMVGQATDLAELAQHFKVCILRIRTTLIEADQIKDLVKAVIDAGVAKSRLHLVIDQYSIVGATPAACVSAVRPYLDAALARGCASTTLAGGSFPINLVGRKQGLHDIERVEWNTWTSLIKEAAYEQVLYGDYTVSNPAPSPDLDPTTMNPSVAIRYASDGFWRLFKAGGFKKGKKDQYKSLCLLLKGDHVYCGQGFSHGDDCYHKASVGTLGNGNPSSWRRDATNHHLVFTASKI